MSTISAVWSHRGVLRLLVQRDLTVKYQESILGYFWSLIEPLSLAAIYYFVFGVIYGAKKDPMIGAGQYPLYIISGIFAWMWVNAALGESTKALVSQARLINTINIPRQIYPLGRVIGRFTEYLAGVPILVLAVFIFGGQITWQTALALPLALLIQAVYLIGWGLLLSSLNVMVRDVERVMRLVLRVLFYATPIIYPISKVMDADMPGWLKVVYEMNPLVGIIGLHHAAWFPGLWPSNQAIIAASVGSVLVLLVGALVFRKLEPAVLKEL